MNKINFKALSAQAAQKTRGQTIEQALPAAFRHIAQRIMEQHPGTSAVVGKNKKMLLELVQAHADANARLNLEVRAFKPSRVERRHLTTKAAERAYILMQRKRFASTGVFVHNQLASDALELFLESELGFSQRAKQAFPNTLIRGYAVHEKKIWRPQNTLNPSLTFDCKVWHFKRSASIAGRK